ncbi:MAG TPA: head GIN domain-containing protein [Chitinophagaceae bacterium]
MKRLFVLAACLLILFSSCHYFHGKKIKGNGNVTTQTRSFSNFKGVDVSSAIDLYIKQDPAFSVKVEIDEDLQQYIIITVEHDVLHIRQENNTSLDATGKIKVYVSAPAFKEILASGACKVISENLLTTPDAIVIHVSGASNATLELKAPRISADMTGASEIKLKGETKDLSIEGSGASHARCFDLMSENADIELSGASSANVMASVKIDAKASGASDVRYKGNASVSQNTSGAASVKKVE